MKTPIGIGVIGLGRHGLRYVRHLVEIPQPGAALIAACRRDATQAALFAARYGIPVFRDFRDVIAHPSVDAVVVVVPPAYAPEICLEAVKRGKPVLTEKPLATTAKEARRMVEAAAAAHVPLMTAHTVRFEAAAQALRKEIESVGTRRYLVLSNRIEERPEVVENAADYGGRGVLLETGIHLIDLIRFLTGEEIVEVRCEVDRASDGEAERRALASLRTGGDFHCVIDSYRGTGGRVSRAEWIGECGQVGADWIQHRLWRVTGRNVVEEWYVEDQPTVVTVLRLFLSALAEGAPMPVTGLDGQRAVEVAEACYQSAADGGRRVRVDEM